MKKILLSFALVLSLSACSLQRTPFVNTTQIQDIDFSNIKTFRQGSDCSYWVLGLIGPFGDSSLKKAIEDANISKASLVDYSAHWYLLFSKSCIIVYGK